MAKKTLTVDLLLNGFHKAGTVLDESSMTPETWAWLITSNFVVDAEEAKPVAEVVPPVVPQVQEVPVVQETIVTTPEPAATVVTADSQATLELIRESLSKGKKRIDGLASELGMRKRRCFL